MIDVLVAKFKGFLQATITDKMSAYTNKVCGKANRVPDKGKANGLIRNGVLSKTNTSNWRKLSCAYWAIVDMLTYSVCGQTPYCRVKSQVSNGLLM